jgi:hypothetical protein
VWLSLIVRGPKKRKKKKEKGKKKKAQDFVFKRTCKKTKRSNYNKEEYRKPRCQHACRYFDLRESPYKRRLGEFAPRRGKALASISVPK